jgi:type VI secretion system protein ImpF
MTALNNRTRLSPPLMFVFRTAHQAKDAKSAVEIRNAAGDRVIAARRLHVKQVITESTLRREVSRDLEMLLNSVALESSLPMTDAALVRKSILNFGIPDLTHRTIDETGMGDIAEEIKGAIISFEPRLSANSIQVERDTSIGTSELKVRFMVRADLTCDPIHVAVEFVADVVEAGKVIIQRL